MKVMLFYIPATVLLACLTGNGCALGRPPSEEAPARWHASGFHPTMPDRRFSDYRDIFKYIAAWEDLPQNSGTILGLAADSTVERSYLNSAGAGTLLVIRAEYYGQSTFGIRGAQGNGRYYAFQLVENGWRLVGIFHANRLQWEIAGDQTRVLAHWHMSAEGDAPTVYTWQGRRFE
jgi:hypothetical protein